MNTKELARVQFDRFLQKAPGDLPYQKAPNTDQFQLTVEAFCRGFSISGPAEIFAPGTALKDRTCLFFSIPTIVNFLTRAFKDVTYSCLGADDSPLMQYCHPERLIYESLGKYARHGANDLPEIPFRVVAWIDPESAQVRSQFTHNDQPETLETRPIGTPRANFMRTGLPLDLMKPAIKHLKKKYPVDPKLAAVHKPIHIDALNSTISIIESFKHDHRTEEPFHFHIIPTYHIHHWITLVVIINKETNKAQCVLLGNSDNEGTESPSYNLVEMKIRERDIPIIPFGVGAQCTTIKVDKNCAFYCLSTIKILIGKILQYPAIFEAFKSFLIRSLEDPLAQLLNDQLRTHLKLFSLQHTTPAKDLKQAVYTYFAKKRWKLSSRAIAAFAAKSLAYVEKKELMPANETGSGAAEATTAGDKDEV